MGARIIGRVRAAFDGNGPYLALVVAGALVGLAFLAGTAMDPVERLAWTGVTVRAVHRGGIIFYQYRGQTYTLDEINAAGRHAATVHLDPHDPSIAIPDDPVAQWLTVLTVVGPLALGLLLAGAGLARKRRSARIRAGLVTAQEKLGWGIDDELMQQLLARQRAGADRPAPVAARRRSAPETFEELAAKWGRRDPAPLEVPLPPERHAEQRSGQA